MARYYLFGRTQFVQVCHKMSNATSCSSGNPQGSILGPLLFTAHTFHHLRNWTSCSSSITVSSWTTPSSTPPSTLLTQPSVNRLTNCLEAVHRLLLQNQLQLNADKIFRRGFSHAILMLFEYAFAILTVDACMNICIIVANIKNIQLQFKNWSQNLWKGWTYLQPQRHWKLFNVGGNTSSMFQ
jgi:hypothetical protein